MGMKYDITKKSILDKLRHPIGYQGRRIRPHPTEKTAWLAEMYTADQMRARKSWKALLTEAGEFQTFATPEAAQQAFIESRGEPFAESQHQPAFSIQLLQAMPEEEHWRSLFWQKEGQAEGSLETMIEDAAARLVAAMHELRETSSQKRANTLREIIEGQSNRLYNLAQFVNQEAKNLY